MSIRTSRGNVRLFMKDWGTGRPVIMIHGWPLSSDTFDDLGLVVANAGFRAVAYDRRGFGRSEQPWDGYDYDILSDDLADVVRHVGGKDVTLVGFSMAGGEIARYMSRHGGEGVSRLVLISSVAPYMLKTTDNPNGVEHKVFDQMTLAIQEDRAHFWTGFFKDFYGTGVLSSAVSEEERHWSRALAMKASLKATLDCAHAFATTDFRPDLKSITVPTLVIHGTSDKTVPIDATGRVSAKTITGARLIEYDGAHGLLATHKTRIAEDVLGFLR
jgi:non-heme chloroperoxidase